MGCRWNHSNKSEILNGVSPAFCSFPKDRNTTKIAILSCLEVQLGPLDVEHLGRVVAYNQKILEAQPFRQSIVSAVTNLKQLVFIKSSSDTTVEIGTGPVIHVEYSPVFLLRESEGWNRFITFLNQGPFECGWKPPSIPGYEPTSVLSSAQKYCVYEAINKAKKTVVEVKVGTL